MKTLMAIGLLVLGGCQTVTIRPHGGQATMTEPDVALHQHFFVFGLAPDARFIDVTKACNGNDVIQMQAQESFLDGFLSIVTIGIYTPRTARIWCGKHHQSRSFPHHT